MKCRMLFKRCASFFSSLWHRASHIALSRGISRALRNFGLCLLVVFLSTLSPLYSSSVSASGIPSGYHLVTNVAGYPYFQLRYGRNGAIWQACQSGSTGVGSLGLGASVTMTIDVFDGAGCNAYYYLPANAIIEFQMRTLDIIFQNAGFLSHDNRFMSIEVDPLFQSGNENIYTFRFWNNGPAVNNYYLQVYFEFYVATVNATVEPISVNIYAPDNTLDYSGSLNSINSSVNNVNNSIQGVISGVGGVQSSVNNAANQAHQDSQAQIDAINDQTQQEQNQYEQEKVEENQREDEMDGQASQAESMFSFTFLNPFIGIFELFNDSGCVSIPTIAGMVGSSNTTYCPWFDSSVRNILTPVFGFSSMILLFGFVIYWLRSGSSDILYKGGKK